MSAKLYHQASAGETAPKKFRKKLYVKRNPYVLVAIGDGYE
jgi:hypothetical protein